MRTLFLLCAEKLGLKKMVLGLTLVLFTPILGQARVYPKAETLCHFFKNNQVTQTSVCTVEGGGGAGGYEMDILLPNGKKYSVGTHFLANGDDSYSYVDDKPALEYERDSALKVAKGMHVESVMKCYRAEDESIDVCYVYPNTVLD